MQPLLLLLVNNNMQMTSFALLTVGWILCTTALGFTDWWIWHMSSPPSLALVGLWKVCIYHAPHSGGLSFCYRYALFNSYLPPYFYNAQYLMLLGSILGLLGKVFLTVALKIMIMEIRPNKKNNFLVSGFLCTFSSICIIISIIYTYQATKNDQEINFPPSFLLPSRPSTQELGSAVPVDSLAAIMIFLSGFFPLLHIFPVKDHLQPLFRES